MRSFIPASVITKVLLPLRLTYQNPGQQSPGLGDQKAAGLEQQPNLKSLESAFDRRRIFCDFGGRIEGGS